MLNKNISTTPVFQKTNFYSFLTVGFIAGALLALLNAYLPSLTFSIFPYAENAPSPSKLLLFYYWIIFYAFMFLFAYPNTQSLKKIIFITLIPSFLACLPFYWGGYNTTSQCFLMLISAYALNAFHINYQTNGSHLSYHTLCYAVWDTFVKLLIALFFSLFCWFVLFLCASLFNFINVYFFTQLISENWFEYWVTALFISTGLYIATQTDTVVRNIRLILLLTCQYLLIPLALIGIVFVFSLLIETSTHHIKWTSQYLFSSIAFLCVLFVNGVYQDGLSEKPYPLFLIWVCRIFIWITPIFTLIALYTIYFYSNNNLNSNGWNTDNYPFLFNVTLLLIYNITYAIIALFPQKQQKQWFKPIECANIVLAIFLIVVTMVTTHPSFIRQFPQPKYKFHQSKAAFQNTNPSTQSKKPKDDGSWLMVRGQIIPTHATIFGYHPDPIYLCRASVAGKDYPGTVKNHTCEIANGEQVVTSTHFTVYAEPARKVYFSAYYPLADQSRRLDVGFSGNKSAYVCRTIYQNYIHLGTYNNGLCTFVADGKVVHSDRMAEYLYLNNQ